jgi:DUSAM domain-containing protein
MDYKWKPLAGEWEQLRELELRIAGGGELELTPQLRDFLISVGPLVGMPQPDPSDLLKTPREAANFVIEARGRIREGSRRLGAAITAAAQMRDLGQAEDARRKLLEVVDNETVPFYREIAESELAALEDQ